MPLLNEKREPAQICVMETFTANEDWNKSKTEENATKDPSRLILKSTVYRAGSSRTQKAITRERTRKHHLLSTEVISENIEAAPRQQPQENLVTTPKPFMDYEMSSGLRAETRLDMSWKEGADYV